MLEVAEHYYHFGGKSPINDQNRQLIAALEAELAEHGPRLPSIGENRNWHPMLTDTLHQMKAMEYSARGFCDLCLQFVFELPAISGRYRNARRGRGWSVPVVDKIRAFHNHPGFIEAAVDRVKSALAMIPKATVNRQTYLLPRTAFFGDGTRLRLREATQ